jgi:hypothetical protein
VKRPDPRHEKPLRGPSGAARPNAGADGGIDVAGVEGKLKKRALGKMSKLVDEHPDEAVSALRRWLHER